MSLRSLLCLICFLLSMGVHQTQAQSIDKLITEAQQLEKIPDEKSALVKYRQTVLLDGKNLLGLYKSAELCCRIGARQQNEKTRDIYFQLALDYANAAIKYHPNHDEANVAMSMTLGRIALNKGGKEKIKLVKQIKDFADNAVRINPNNFKAWHIIGKWNYEVANLNFIEQTAIEVFYGGLPDASFSRSIEAYEKAKSINPYFSLNYLELAKAYHKKDNNKKALDLLLVIQKLPITTEDDIKIKKEALELIKDWD